MVTEHRSTDGGNREGQVVIKVSQDLGINEIKGDVVVVHSGVLGDHIRVLSGSIPARVFSGFPSFPLSTKSRTLKFYFHLWISRALTQLNQLRFEDFSPGFPARLFGYSRDRTSKINRAILRCVSTAIYNQNHLSFFWTMTVPLKKLIIRTSSKFTYFVAKYVDYDDSKGWTLCRNVRCNPIWLVITSTLTSLTFLSRYQSFSSRMRISFTFCVFMYSIFDIILYIHQVLGFIYDNEGI